MAEKFPRWYGADHLIVGPHEHRLKKLRRYAYNCIWLLLLFLWSAGGASSAPGAKPGTIYWVFGVALLLLLFIFIMPRLAKRALASDRVGLAYALAIFPIVPFALYFLWIGLWIGVAFVIEIMQVVMRLLV